jgi:hypothetical protein
MGKSVGEWNKSRVPCRLVGADRESDTITLELPSGLRPDGLVIGQCVFISVDPPEVEKVCAPSVHEEMRKQGRPRCWHCGVELNQKGEG